jgi:signal transduction histidine kinase
LTILGNRLKAKPQRPAIVLLKEYGDLPPVLCHAGSMNQVFMNILANALDALEERDRQRSYAEVQAEPSQIRIATTASATQVRISIEDNGLGIPEAVRSRVFDPFFTTKPVGKGTGLGMSICYQIVTEKHGGNLYCGVSPEGGASFTIELPLIPTDTSDRNLQFSQPLA